MQDRGLFINAHVRTGELLEAGSELRDYGLRASDWAYSHLIRAPITADPERLGFLLHPVRLSRSLRRSWVKAENATARLLVAARVLDYPRDVTYDVADDLESGAVFQTVPRIPRDVAIDFFTQRLTRLEVLGKTQLRDELGSAVWASLVYEESAVLRGGIFNQVYYEGSWS